MGAVKAWKTIEYVPQRDLQRVILCANRGQSLIIGECCMEDQHLAAKGGCVEVIVRIALEKSDSLANSVYNSQ